MSRSCHYYKYLIVLTCIFLLTTNCFAADPQELSAIVVTGEKLESYAHKNPSQVVVMGSKEIESRNFLAVGEALGSMSGVEVSRTSSGLGSRIAIRGGGGSGSVLVLIDGRPAATMQYGGVDLSSLPIEMVKKIIVFKPPVPVWLGPGSAAGAIYIETKKSAARKKKPTSARVRVFGGSFGQVAASGSIKTGWDGGHDLMIAGGGGHKDGKRDNSQYDQGHLSLNYGKKADLMDVQLNGRVFVSEHGSAGPTYNPTPNASQKYEKGSLDLKVKGEAGKSVDYEVKTFVDVKSLTDESNSGFVAELDQLSAGVGTDLFFAVGEEDEFRMGFSGKHDQVDHTLSGDHDRTLVSLNGVYNFRLGAFKFSTGLRGDYATDFDACPGGHVGISYEAATGTLFKVNAGYSENIPSFGQLYQPSHGSIDQVRGNPDLKKEQIVSTNIGLIQTFDAGHELEISFFRTDTSDLIKYVRGTDLINRPVNISNAWKQGVEASAKIKFTAQTRLSLSYVWQKTENEDNGKELGYAPRHLVKAAINTTLPIKTKIELSAKAVSAQYTDLDNTESQRLDDYVCFNAKIIQPFVLFGHKTEIFVHLNNLLDTDFAVHYGYPDDGFRWVCGCNINF